MAISKHLDQLLIPRDVIYEIFDEKIQVQIFEDNTSTKIMLDGCQNKKLRHLLLHSCAIRKEIDEGTLKLRNIEGAYQIAYILMKAVNGQNFRSLMVQIFNLQKILAHPMGRADVTSKSNRSAEIFGKVLETRLLIIALFLFTFLGWIHGNPVYIYIVLELYKKKDVMSDCCYLLK